jgi:ubiquinone biosynthesis protein UbiJ
MTTTGTSTNARQVAQLEKALAEMLAEALRRGFFGTAAVEVCVQDGTIQHIRRKVEQIEK